MTVEMMEGVQVFAPLPERFCRKLVRFCKRERLLIGCVHPYQIISKKVIRCGSHRYLLTVNMGARPMSAVLRPLPRSPRG
jgi:hypothetical protein